MANNVPIVPAKSWLDIAASARSIINDVKPGLLKAPDAFPLIDFIEFRLRDVLNFNFYVEDLPYGVEAQTDPDNRIIVFSPATYEALFKDDGRARFTAAHEIGHAKEHAGYLQSIISHGHKVQKYNRGDIKPYFDPEAQANVFAASLLMPSEALWLLKKQCDGKNMIMIEEMMRIFKVSKSAASNRWKNLLKY